MCVANEILFLPAVGVIAEVTIHAAANIFGLAHVNDLSFLVVEVIHAGRTRQHFKIVKRHVGIKVAPAHLYAFFEIRHVWVLIK